MIDSAGDSLTVEAVGTLQWNEFEGGFWSLQLDPEHPTLGGHVVLSQFDPPPGASDGSAIRARVIPRPDLIDFTMAGLRVEVLDAQLDAGS